MSVSTLAAACAVAIAMTLPGTAFAYIGPGAGLGAIGSLVAVIGAVLLAIVGLLVLPIRMLARRRKAKSAGADKPATAAGQAQPR